MSHDKSDDNAPSTSYVYTVRAKDGAGNTSAPGNAITAATLAEVDAFQR